MDLRILPTAFRRSSAFLALPLLLPAAAAFPGGEPVEGGSAGGHITHGPMVGHVDADTARVMCRTNRPTPVYLIYARDADLTLDTSLTETKWPKRDDDFTVHFELQGLQPETTYYYLAVAGSPPRYAYGMRPPIPTARRFTTPPSSGTERDFSFVVFADANSYQEEPAPAYRRGALELPAFVMQIGDWDHRNPGDLDNGEVRERDWWRMHRDMLGDHKAGEQFAKYVLPYFPVYHVWDDHDYAENNANGTYPNKHMALAAFKDYFPTPDLPNPDNGIWHSFRWAQCEFFMLDTRMQRDVNGDPDDASKSMLDGFGIANDQKTWLLNGLQNSTATWKFLVSSSCWNPNGKPVDSWHLFQTEQQEIVDFVQQNGVTGVVVLSADIHSGGGLDDGTNSYFPELTVPPTNMDHPIGGCTGGSCGDWSHGIIRQGDPDGYGLVVVEHDDVLGTDTLRLQARANNGALRLEYVVTLP